MYRGSSGVLLADGPVLSQDILFGDMFDFAAWHDDFSAEEDHQFIGFEDGVAFAAEDDDSVDVLGTVYLISQRNR
ncbi:MAG: hypothetical protein BWK76_14070 [Desulfobulbaceae bacterium A2]|nr:MAG: hypothetical protein BWK76_14070 [Desulfobulbaceae bacterium A2]